MKRTTYGDYGVKMRGGEDSEASTHHMYDDMDKLSNVIDYGGVARRRIPQVESFVEQEKASVEKKDGQWNSI